MRNTIFILTIVLLGGACSKHSDKPVPNPGNRIFGEWQHTASYISPGGPVDWASVKNGAFLIIHEDSSYLVKNTDFKFWPYSQLLESGKLGATKKWDRKLTYALPNGKSDTAFYYPIRVNQDTLELAGLCIEGCVYRFRKIK
ncbi:hypothetical protein [Niabella beijingensis]|uniref:hypothetical protein n=1 Tax=Niabella beijingensis TaxID=2872700 RepID=UPI001CBFD7D7|nr:hypothetical protein [Niabella beijingensis]MBZ4189701.1 hypothetical protein [Niabella beijingensis]